ncbi:MAG: tyrosine-type recombinase/integrase, partial [Lachnospiraceae bacterium]|nr:tyrosine-type recombinase/integrase [Lachnospiraceae bacterium]
TVTTKKVTPHILRHTHASLLMSQGVNIDTISRRLGHEDSKITKEIYLHVTKLLIEKDKSQIEGINLL